MNKKKIVSMLKMVLFYKTIVFFLVKLVKYNTYTQFAKFYKLLKINKGIKIIINMKNRSKFNKLNFYFILCL